MYDNDEDCNNVSTYADVSKQIRVKLEAIVDACLLENNRLLKVEDDEEVVKIAAPLTDLLKGCKTKRQRVTVEGKSLEAFYVLQKLASEAPVLKIALWKEAFEVITDASNIDIGAILQQDSRPVAFYNKKMDSTQRNYSIYDKELFVIISALKHWKHFLYGGEFKVKTDHQALKWLQTMPSADWSDRQARWSQIFHQYGGMIECLPRKHNPVADALSKKSNLVQTIQPAIILEIQGPDLDCMKGEYPDCVEFTTSYNLAMAGASEETPMLVNYLITSLQQAMANPALQGEVQQQLQAYGFIPPHQEERIPEKSLGETSKRGISKVREGENLYEELRNLLLDDTHQSRRRGHAQRQEPPSKEKEKSESPDKSMEEDVAPRRRRAQRSPTPTKRKRSPHSPPCRESKKEEKDSK
ncbi:hypothetical protein L7F22_035910 [Adiantum nelumboides]|nr:hypothetical protein [Adiantum nelumboides]